MVPGDGESLSAVMFWRSGAYVTFETSRIVRYWVT